MRHVILVLSAAGAAFAAWVWPRVPQDPAYHLMADTRSCLGLPNCLNVLSNFPFALIGLYGLFLTRPRRYGPQMFSDPWERWPYVTFFVAAGLTALGSSYYHLAPDNGRLVWDRLPMTLGFMALLTALLAERVDLAIGRRLFVPVLGIGVASVIYWYWSELRNAGDLRLYGLVQFGSLLLVLLVLMLYPSPYPRARYLFAGLAAYGLAKVFEFADAPVFARGQIVSGHTLKHLLGAVGLVCVAAMLKARISGVEANKIPADRSQVAGQARL